MVSLQWKEKAQTEMRRRQSYGGIAWDQIQYPHQHYSRSENPHAQRVSVLPAEKVPGEGLPKIWYLLNDG